MRRLPREPQRPRPASRRGRRPCRSGLPSASRTVCSPLRQRQMRRRPRSSRTRRCHNCTCCLSRLRRCATARPVRAAAQAGALLAAERTWMATPPPRGSGGVTRRRSFCCGRRKQGRAGRRERARVRRSERRGAASEWKCERRRRRRHERRRRAARRAPRRGALHAARCQHCPCFTPCLATGALRGALRPCGGGVVRFTHSLPQRESATNVRGGRGNPAH